MILGNFEIEFKGKISYFKKREIKKKLKPFIKQIKTIEVVLVGDNKILLHELADCVKIFEKLSENNPKILADVEFDNTFAPEQRKLKISISDNDTDFKESFFPSGGFPEDI